MPRNDQESWAAFRNATLGIPVMLRAALISRKDAIRVARVARQLHVDAVAELGESEAEDLVGATLRLVRDRVVDIFGPSAWDEASPSEPS